MSVRKRIRKYKDGQVRETWLVDYVDGGGVRHTESFARKKEADARHAEVRVNVGKGIHTPTSLSKTVAQAADDWLSYVEGEGRERATLAQYRGHVVHHIVPRIGNERLATLTKPRIELLRDQLVHDLKTRATAKKVLTTLKSILKDAARRGNVAQNVATDTTITISKRDDEKLEIGKDIPDPAEIKAILGAAQGRWRPFLIAAIFTGMRVSELRGLRWQDVDFDAKVVRVRQRADRYGKIGPPKSQSSRRDIPIGPFVVNTLKEWRLACPHELVFPNGVGNVENLSNIIWRGWWPTQVAAGVVDAGKPKYKGIHALRHFYASWSLNREEAGGQGLPLKEVQHLMGHASITMTADRYGHLFPSQDDGAKLAKAELRLLG